MSDYELFNGDCLDILSTLEAGSIDAVITDPPYGINFKYNSHDDSPDGYGEWMWSIIEYAESLCTGGSPLFVWQAMLNVKRFTEWFPREWRIFAAAKNFVQMRPTAMQYAFDPVLVWWTPGSIYSAATNSRDWHVANTAATMNRRAGDAGGHPCARPLDQVEHIIKQWVKPGGIVIDPFMGSGTTGVAAMRTGRRFIGIELDPDYFKIAETRIKNAAGDFVRTDKEKATGQLALFDGGAPFQTIA